MQSHAIDGRHEINGAGQDDDLSFHLGMVDTKGRIWQLRLREVEMKLVRVHYGEALKLGCTPPVRRFQHRWLVASVSKNLHDPDLSLVFELQFELSNGGRPAGCPFP